MNARVLLDPVGNQSSLLYVGCPLDSGDARESCRETPKANSMAMSQHRWWRKKSLGVKPAAFNCSYSLSRSTVRTKRITPSFPLHFHRHEWFASQIGRMLRCVLDFKGTTVCCVEYVRIYPWMKLPLVGITVREPDHSWGRLRLVESA